MNWKVFVGFALAFILLTIVCTVGQMGWIDNEVAPLFIVLKPLEYGATAWMAAVGDMVMFRYTFFEGSWIIARWVFFLPVSIGFMIGLALALLQAVASAVGGLFRAFRPM